MPHRRAALRGPDLTDPTSGPVPTASSGGGGPLRALLTSLLGRGKGTSAYPVAGDITERLAGQILADVLPRAARGLLLMPRLGACAGVPLVGRGVRLTNPQLIRCGRGFVVEDGAELQGLSTEGLRFGDNVTVGRAAQVRCSGYYGRDRGRGLVVGDDSSIGPQAFIGASGGITLGRKVIMGPAVVVLSEEHNLDAAGVPVKDQGVRHLPTVIEDGVWIGARVVVLGGVRVGEGAVLAAGSVVTRDVAAGAVVAGVPARELRSRA